MSFPFRKLCPLWMVSCLVLCLFCRATAQRSPIGASPSLAPTMRQLIRQSGSIFAGTVLKVEHLSATRPGELATVRTTFLVEQAIRGVRAGQILEIREWAGLWDSGERYRAGEHVLLLLYPRSKLGLTSPVGGAMGRFNVNSHEKIVLQDAQMRTLSAGLAPARTSHETGRVSAKDLLRAIRHEVAE